MAINPETTTTVKVSELASAGFNTTDLVPHEVGGYLKKGTLQDLATFIGGIISTEGSVAFKAVHITDGQTLPATTTEEFILVGPGTYPNVGGGSQITTTEPLSALVSNGTYWYIGVEIPITASGAWGAISGELSDQTDLQNALDLKADLVGGKVPSSQLPSYVDDVVEVANYASLPSTGETGKIYVTLDNNKIYRWSGSVYIEIASNNAVWGAITGTLSSQTDLQSALNAKQNSLSGTGFVKISGSTISYDNSTYVPTSRTITINGTAYDLSADRSWTINSATWGSITGTLSSQTDLQTALNAKANASNVVDLSSNQVIQGLKEFNVVRPVLGMNLSLRISDISTSGEDNGMLRMIDNTTFNELFVVESDGTVFAKSFIKKNGTSSQYLMADGSVSTGGGVSGSGTTNYIPKWTSGTAIGISSIYDNGTNVGIGTTSPSAKLDVHSVIRATNTSSAAFSASSLELFSYNGTSVSAGTALFSTNSNFTYGTISSNQTNLYGVRSGGIRIATENAPIIFSNGNSDIDFAVERMRITSGGNVLVGTTTDSGYKLDINGTVRATAGFFNSDIRLKELVDYDYNVSEIKPISYLWKDGRDDKKHVGYSAQEVQKVMPDAVNEGTDGMLSVNYVEVLVAKIAQMEKEIELLKSK